MSIKNDKKMRIAIDCDDAGVTLKAALVEFLQSQDIEVTDLNYLGSNSQAMYPEVGYALALKVSDQMFDRGTLICGTGMGMAMTANKVEGIYASVCNDV